MGICQGLTGPMMTGAILMISLWGIIFLGIVGGLFQNYSVGLIEDVPEEEKDPDWAVRFDSIKKLYKDNAKNCWYACGAYVIVFLYASIRMFMIVKTHRSD